jgi:hypothetical protein
MAGKTMKGVQPTSRFGHHPDPAVDFCIEVDCIEGDAYDFRAGINDREAPKERITRAMTFIIGGDPYAIRAKGRLRELEAAIAGAEGRTTP